MVAVIITCSAIGFILCFGIIFEIARKKVKTLSSGKIHTKEEEM